MESQHIEIADNPEGEGWACRYRDGPHTFIEWLRELKSVDELRVEARSDLNTHTTDKEVKIHDPQVGLLVPWHLVLLDHARNDWIGSMANVWRLEDAHDGGVGDAGMLAVTFAKPWGWNRYLYLTLHIPTPVVFPRRPKSDQAKAAWATAIPNQYLTLDKRLGAFLCEMLGTG